MRLRIRGGRMYTRRKRVGIGTVDATRVARETGKRTGESAGAGSEGG